MNQESEHQVRPTPFFFIRKSVKNRTKNSLKKLTFITLRPTRFFLQLTFTTVFVVGS